MMKQSTDYIEKKMGKLISDIESNPDSWKSLIEFGKFYKIVMGKKGVLKYSSFYDKVKKIASKEWSAAEIDLAIFRRGIE